MTTITTWALMPPTTADELLWIRSIGCEVTIERDTRPILAVGKQSHYEVAGRIFIEIVSNTAEQESMLKLKFTDRLWFKNLKATD